ncbi:MAG: hypothetical protein D5R99_00645 [Methanocalculus sp. MSAO_Arc1]|nr:MAG: hypothetical protein D5R99_00645 [Methanocalculus sp. MSAO_Arc1]
MISCGGGCLPVGYCSPVSVRGAGSVFPGSWECVVWKETPTPLFLLEKNGGQEGGKIRRQRRGEEKGKYGEIRENKGKRMRKRKKRREKEEEKREEKEESGIRSRYVLKVQNRSHLYLCFLMYIYFIK